MAAVVRANINQALVRECLSETASISGIQHDDTSALIEQLLTWAARQEDYAT